MPSPLQQQQLAEGETNVKDAEKAVKTSMFKWKPDWELGAELYDKAGMNFKLAKAHDRGIAAFKEASAAHKNYGALFHAAKSLENAANCARDARSNEECEKLLKTAAHLYRRHGSSDNAATALENAAKDADKQNNPELAMTLYMEVVDIRETEDQVRRMKVPLDRAVQMSIRAKKFKMTMEYLNKEALLLTQLKDEPMLNRNWMSRIIVTLALADFNTAETLFNEAMTAPAFSSSDEMFACDRMLDAYDCKDQEKLKEVTRDQIFSFLSNDTALLARKLKAIGGNGRAEKKVIDLQTRMDSDHYEPAAPAAEPEKKPEPAKLQEEAPQATEGGGADVPADAAAADDSDEDDLL